MSGETAQHPETGLPMDFNVVKPNRRLRRTGSIIKDFSLNTSTNGIPNIARSETILNRIFWSVATLICTGVMIFFVVKSILAYFDYPTQTSVSVIVEWPQAFPAVTICNYSPVRFDQLIGPFQNYKKSLNLTITSTFTSADAEYVLDFLQYTLNRGESVTDYFFSLSSMMMQCTYNGVRCSANNFTTFLSSSYGICYTFNAKLKNTIDGGIRYNSDDGGTGQLQLSLYAHSHQYVPYLTSGIGMVALVHDNIMLPTIELGGMLIAPGNHHKFGYLKQINTFLPSPYTNCNDKTNRGMQLVFDNYNGTDYGYSEYMCYATCIQAYTYQKCGCGNPYRWTVSSIILPNSDKVINITFCDLNNPCYGEAATEIMNAESLSLSFCPDCTQECSTSQFTIEGSSVMAPPDYLLNDIKQFVESTKVPLPTNWSTLWPSIIRGNYLELEVDYITTQTQVYTQQATLGPIDVVSNVGGQTGLWIGISFLSLMQIVELLFRLARSQHYRFQKVLRKWFKHPTNGS